MLSVSSERAGSCSVGYDSDIGAVVITWLRNDNAIFQEMLTLELQLVEEHGAASVIVDTSTTTGVLNDENQEWLVDVHYPKLTAAGLRAQISVTPKSATATLVNKRWERAGAQLPFAVVTTSSLEAAYDLARRVKHGETLKTGAAY